jgi:hypothetical protein
MRNKQPQIVNVKRAAEMIGCTERNILYLLAKGELAGWQVNRKCWAVEVASVERYKKEKAK